MVMTRSQRAAQEAAIAAAAASSCAAGSGGGSPALHPDTATAAAVIAALHEDAAGGERDDDAPLGVGTSTTCEPNSDGTDYEVDRTLLLELQESGSEGSYIRVKEMERNGKLPQCLLVCLKDIVLMGEDARVLDAAMCVCDMSEVRAGGAADEHRRKTLAYRMVRADLHHACIEVLKRTQNTTLAVYVAFALVYIAEWYPEEVMAHKDIFPVVLVAMKTSVGPSEFLATIVSLVRCFCAVPWSLSQGATLELVHRLHDIVERPRCERISFIALAALENLAQNTEAAQVVLSTPVVLTILAVLTGTPCELGVPATGALAYLVPHMTEASMTIFLRSGGLRIVAYIAGNSGYYDEVSRTRCFLIMGFVAGRAIHLGEVLTGVPVWAEELHEALCREKTDPNLRYACMHLLWTLWTCTPDIMRDPQYAALRHVLSGETYAAVRRLAGGTGAAALLARDVVSVVSGV